MKFAWRFVSLFSLFQEQLLSINNTAATQEHRPIRPTLQSHATSCTFDKITHYADTYLKEVNKRSKYKGNKFFIEW